MKNIAGSLVVVCHLLLSSTLASAAERIEDNSFLIEEAYNQEAGVVQHINVFSVDWDSGDWEYGFTQEWPLFSRQHQLSYSVPVLSLDSATGRNTGIGDILLNYRHQTIANETVAFAPRLSAVLPTGDDAEGLGSGNFAAQINMPLSVLLHEEWITHVNAGVTLPFDSDADETYQFGQSVIYLMHPKLNLMLETLWRSSGGTDSLFISPGLRGAIDFANGLQIVPGVAMPIGVGPSKGDQLAFFYLSFEHPFQKSPAATTQLD